MIGKYCDHSIFFDGFSNAFVQRPIFQKIKSVIIQLKKKSLNATKLNESSIIIAMGNSSAQLSL